MTNALGYIEVLPLTLLSATYQAHVDGFIRVVQHAANDMVHPRTGGRWRLDGYTSDRLFLRLYLDGGPLIPEYLELEVNFSMTSKTVTIRILSRLPSVHELFEQFTEQLDQYLLRKAG